MIDDPSAVVPGSALAALVEAVRACRLCVEAPVGAPLPHPPRPVLRPSSTARLLIASQAPGARVHASGIPFDDASGDRLRAWMGLDRTTFYDQARIAILAMGFCFPGIDQRGADRPPRRECAPAWRADLMAAMPQVELVLVIGQYAKAWHMPDTRGSSLTHTVSAWRDHLARRARPQVLPLPHPSWRNTGWLKRHPWFEAECIPELQDRVRAAIAP